MRYLWTVLGLLFVLPQVSVAQDYVLGAEDVLTISVYGKEELSREVVVLEDGHFNYPIVGRVEARGKTAPEVASVISQGLRVELRNPQVTVSVKQPAMRRVYISGLVPKAGAYDLKPGWRISHLIAEAGGLQERPELTKAILVRGEENMTVDLDRALASSDRQADFALIPGDLLQVQADTNLVHVAGQVAKPGDFRVQNHLGVLELVAMAGGPTETAALTRAQLIRRGSVIPINLHTLLVDGKTDGNIEVQAGDTLVVPRNEARIAVLGGVGQPGFFELPDGQSVTVADALGMAGGPKQYSRTRQVALVRTVEGKQVVSEVNMDAFLRQGDLSQNPSVRPGDVVYVQEGREPIQAPNILQAITALASPLLFTFLR